MHLSGPRARRGAFTLIELLVVIAIIAILMGLLLAGVMVYLKKIPEMQNRNDITGLSGALSKFKSKYGNYPPSRIRLCVNRGDYGPNPNAQDAESIAVINQLFPKINWSGINWNGQGNIPSPGGVVLEGDQCLVFFLGGIPGGGGSCLGFSNDPTNPSRPPDPSKNGSDRIGPFFEFPASRLKPRGDVGTLGFLSFYDNYGVQPYLYFNSRGRKNGYDSSANSLGVAPYWSGASSGIRQYHAPDSFQIICAGADTMFGPGGQWTPANANAIADPGKDDMTSFYGDRLMGVPE